MMFFFLKKLHQILRIKRTNQINNNPNPPLKQDIIISFDIRSSYPFIFDIHVIYSLCVKSPRKTKKGIIPVQSLIYTHHWRTSQKRK
eukprot:UN03242